MAYEAFSHNRNRSDSAALLSPALDDGSRITTPTSTLLQEMLRDKKAENRRLSRNFDSDSKRGTSSNGLVDRDPQSSPLSSSPSRRRGGGHERRGSAMGGRITSATKGMGVREMEEHVSRLNKQNFDLKLEVFHRRQRNEALEAELEKMKTLEADNAEHRSINEGLVQELELRDVAVQEAVALICELEAKLEGAGLQDVLQSDHGLQTNGARGSNTTIKSQHLNDTPKTLPTSQSPEDQLSPLRQPRDLDQADLASKTLGRPPSFLREKSPSTNALRSVYQSEGGNPSYMSLDRAGSPIRSQDPDTQTLNSPRLSMLSESSFLSVYGKSPKVFDTSDDSEAALARLEAPSDRTVNELDISKRRTHDSLKYGREILPDSRSARSIRGRERQTSRHEPYHSTKSRRDVSAESSSNRSFKHRLEHMSLEQGSSTPTSRDQETSRWLDQSTSGDETSPLQQRARRQKSSRSGRKSPDSGADGNFSSISEVLHEAPNYKLEKIAPLPTLGGPIFGGPNVLPPTPGTMSTHRDPNSSSQSIVTEKSHADLGGFPARNLSAMMPDNRPQTAGTLGTEFDDYADDADEESRSAHAQPSEAQTDAFTKESLQPSFPFMAGGSSSRAMQMRSAMPTSPTRPPLTSYATNVMFDGDGIEEIQPSRGMSYPSPKESRCRSVAYTPTRSEHKQTASGLTQVPPRDPVDIIMNPTPNGSATTPSKPSPHKSSPLKPSSHHKTSIISSLSKESEVPSQEAPSESKIPRTVSSRFGLSAIKNPFRRSISHSTPGVPPVAEGEDDSTANGQPTSRIARPGTSGGGVAASFGGMKMSRGGSLKVKGPSYSEKKG